MRKLSCVLAAGLVAGFATAASAQTNGWYVGGDAGFNIAPQDSFKNEANSTRSWKQTHDLGYGILGQAGYGFGQFRVEGELGWRDNSVDKIKTSVGTFSGSGDMRALSVMGNAYYDVPTGTAFTPFVGAGVGGVNVMPNKVRAGNVTLTNDSDFVFGYQGIAGVSYAVNDNLSLKVDYHYLRTTDADLKEETLGNGTAKGAYSSHTALIGFTYKFGVPEKPVAAAAPAPIPAPAPAPKPVQAAPIAKNFLVFFDFDKSNITPEAERVIDQAAAAAKASNATSISLVGHTDATGSEKYNMALSLRRANAVKAALVKQGVRADEISVVGKGKSELLVATKDGIREPQNRRVQIVLP